MTLLDVQLLVNVIFYFSIFICGFVISIPIGIMKGHNSGNCLLYGSLNVYNSTYATLSYGKTALCTIPIYVSVVLCIFYALGSGIYNFYALYRSRADPTIGSQMWVMPFIMANSLVAVLLFICSCIVSVGFANICGEFTKQSYFKSCPQAQKKTLKDSTTGDDTNTGSFYGNLTVSQLASWVSTLIWIALVVSGIIRSFRNRSLRSQGSVQLESPAAAIANIEPTA